MQDKMNKKNICVPSGIRYISDWKGYDLRDYAFPHILNKTITGCGYTEYCIRNDLNVVLVSPRRLLLENKKKQHPENNVYYAKNDSEKIVEYERDVSVIRKGVTTSILEKLSSEVTGLDVIQKIKDGIRNHILNCMMYKIPCKILVTYDSYRYVKEVLAELGLLEEFFVVIDEFQSILIDARFKSSTELELLYQLRDLQRVCFVSATPMLDEYLCRLDEFKNLPYYQLDWETLDPGRTKKPGINLKFITRGLNEELKKIVTDYLSGIFDRKIYINESGQPMEIYSKEAVFFLNSVKGICNAIVSCGLLPSQCNVLCAKTVENEKRVRLAFDTVLRRLYPDDKKKRMSKMGLEAIGSIPGKDESHKMFTFCTRTVYLGADFYSNNARTFIFSDSNVSCLSVDISMDLEQILGRQRLDENPWKDSATLIVKTTGKKLSKEDFDKIIENKILTTNDLLEIYREVLDSGKKHTLAEKYEKDAVSSAYKDDYVAVNKHAGSDILPVFNNLMLVSEQRAFDIQQIDYKDRFTVFNAINELGIGVTDKEVQKCVNEFNSRTAFSEKLKYLHEAEVMLGPLMESFLELIPLKYKDYYLVFGTTRLKALKYREIDILREWEKFKSNSGVKDSAVEAIYSEFSVGDKILKSEAKEKLRRIYEEHGYQKTPKATDLEEFFNLREYKAFNKETGKRDIGFEILSKK